MALHALRQAAFPVNFPHPSPSPAAAAAVAAAAVAGAATWARERSRSRSLVGGDDEDIRVFGAWVLTRAPVFGLFGQGQPTPLGSHPHPPLSPQGWIGTHP